MSMYTPPDYHRVYITRQKLAPGKIIQPKRGRWFRAVERVMPLVWIVSTYKPWGHR